MPKSNPRQEWHDALTAHFDREYATRPLPAREDLSPAEEAQLQTLGGAIVGWMKRGIEPLLRERWFLEQDTGVKSERPYLVITTSIPGLVAAKNLIFVPRSKDIFFLTPESFRSFQKEHPDDDYQWHIVYSSFFSEKLEPELLAAATEKYPLQDGEQYWVHHESMMAGRLFGRGGEHLWKWDGTKKTLLKEAISQWVS